MRDAGQERLMVGIAALAVLVLCPAQPHDDESARWLSSASAPQEKVLSSQPNLDCFYLECEARNRMRIYRRLNLGDLAEEVK